jgi:hypothetical protein
MPDLTPFLFSLQVLCGYFAVVFLVLALVPGASSQEIGKSK